MNEIEAGIERLQEQIDELRSRLEELKNGLEPEFEAAPETLGVPVDIMLDEPEPEVIEPEPEPEPAEREPEAEEPEPETVEPEPVAEPEPEVEEPEPAPEPEAEESEPEVKESEPAPEQEPEAVSAPKPVNLDYQWVKDIPGGPVANIISGISLNDRVLLINTLFKEDPILFQQTIVAFNGMNSLYEAVEYIKSRFPDWNLASETVYRLMMAARRKLK